LSSFLFKKIVNNWQILHQRKGIVTFSLLLNFSDINVLTTKLSIDLFDKVAGYMSSTSANHVTKLHALGEFISNANGHFQFLQRLNNNYYYFRCGARCGNKTRAIFNSNYRFGVSVANRLGLFSLEPPPPFFKNEEVPFLRP
jgi:hypothetical protein